MRRQARLLGSSLSGDVVVDDQVSRGFPHVTYQIDGFNTAYNPLVNPVGGHKPMQTTLPIVFRSGINPRIADGVFVEDVLAVCEDHLNTKQQTVLGAEAHARASAYIRRAIEELVMYQQEHPEESVG